MARRRGPSYRSERSRSNRDGGIGIAMFKKQEREKAKREHFKMLVRRKWRMH
jgi:hypothetical protein